MFKGGENCTNMDKNTNRWTKIPKGEQNCKKWIELPKGGHTLHKVDRK